MSFSKKLLSGFLAIGLFSGVSSVRALDQIYFGELSEFQKIVMPPGTRSIELATLPSFYRYLQSLFFLTVSNGKEGDDIEGLCALRSYIIFIVTQMKGRGLKCSPSVSFDSKLFLVRPNVEVFKRKFQVVVAVAVFSTGPGSPRQTNRHTLEISFL